MIRRFLLTAIIFTTVSDVESNCNFNGGGSKKKDQKFIFDGNSSVKLSSSGVSSDPILNDFTFCFWMKRKSADRYDTYDDRTVLFHYETDVDTPVPPSSQNLFYVMVFCTGTLWFYDSDGWSPGGTMNLEIPSDGTWHHVCRALDSTLGRHWTYMDGDGYWGYITAVENIVSGGVVYLGRSLITDRYGYPFRGFIGEMAQFYMYDIKLDDKAIKDMALGCNEGDVEGALFYWPVASRDGNYLAENIREEEADMCRRPGCHLEACMTGSACIETGDETGPPCICPNSQARCPADQSSIKYVLDGSSTPYLEYRGEERTLSAVTFCLWTRMASVGLTRTIFEFETFDNSDAANIKSIYLDHRFLLITTHDGVLYTYYPVLGSGTQKVNDGLWHHVCVTATFSDEGIFRLYRDGIRFRHFHPLKRRVQLGVSGTVRLGNSPQKSDVYTFSGDVYGFHMWPEDLADNRYQLSLMARHCGRYTTEGAIITWNHFHPDNVDFHRSGVHEEALDVCEQDN